MQYILSEEEYRELESKDYYFNLSESINKTLYNLSKAFCQRIIDNKKYCDGCPFTEEFIKERFTTKMACPLPKEFSK
jgi:hypothetical protein